MKLRSLKRAPWVLALLIELTACGGGGGSAPKPPEPAEPLPPAASGWDQMNWDQGSWS